jgi:hypothetical protein
VPPLHDFQGVWEQPLGTFLLGSHDFMVTTLASCVCEMGGPFMLHGNASAKAAEMGLVVYLIMVVLSLYLTLVY